MKRIQGLSLPSNTTTAPTANKSLTVGGAGEARRAGSPVPTTERKPLGSRRRCGVREPKYG